MSLFYCFCRTHTHTHAHLLCWKDEKKNPNMSGTLDFIEGDNFTLCATLQFASRQTHSTTCTYSNAQTGTKRHDRARGSLRGATVCVEEGRDPPAAACHFLAVIPMGRVCERVSVSLCAEARFAELSQRGDVSQVCVCVCVSECLRVCVVPLGETEANSGKWIGMEDLARDCGVKMKEFLHSRTHTHPHTCTRTRTTHARIHMHDLSLCFWMHSLSVPLGFH